ncbi:hypothetical protein KU43P_25100 [Pseudomonas sp. KU43P]|nr:hypothetical protein KU43P_25100 [Pseudomonas sp. KU43P]
MNTRSSQMSPGLSPLKVRLLALTMIVAFLLVGAMSLYAYIYYLFPLYDRLLRSAPVVETPYLAFGLLMAPPALAILLLGSAFCAWTGKKFDPPPASRLHRFQTLMFGLSLKTLLYVIPAVMILTTVALLARGYSPCSKLLISGSAWQLFWVKDERVCFKPDHYINDNWPCKVIDGKDICVQVDGR